MQRKHPTTSRIPFPATTAHGPRPTGRRKLTPDSCRLTSGFTLVELLMVIVIIAILVALLLPAIGAVRARVRIGQVSAEITQLETAIAEFKRQHGMEPPSRIALYAPGQTWDAKSRGYIRRMWPQFDFQNSGGLRASDLPSSGSVILEGPECLVFFLGGLPVKDSTGAFRVDGFSKHPTLPFRSSSIAPNRNGPYFEFDTTRLFDSDGDNLPEYRDPLSGNSAPYLYFSSYEGKGYPSTTSNGQWVNTDCASFMRWAYYQRIDTNSDPKSSRPHKPNSFQIISAGFDGDPGTGGYFDPSDPNGSLGGRSAERDNITNFHPGTLAN